MPKRHISVNEQGTHDKRAVGVDEVMWVLSNQISEKDDHIGSKNICTFVNVSLERGSAHNALYLRLFLIKAVHYLVVALPGELFPELYLRLLHRN